MHVSQREECPNTELFLVRIFLYSVRIFLYTPYLSVFSPNTGKYGPEITPYLDTFHAVFGKIYIRIQEQKAESDTVDLK